MRVILIKRPSDIFLSNSSSNWNVASVFKEVIGKFEKSNKWNLENVSFFEYENGVLKEKKFNTFEISSNYNYEKINSLFKNFDTMSFLDLVLNYKDFLKLNAEIIPTRPKG